MTSIYNMIKEVSYSLTPCLSNLLLGLSVLKDSFRISDISGKIQLIQSKNVKLRGKSGTH